MAVSTAQTLKGIHSQYGANARPAIASDFTAVIKGFEQYEFLTKQIPWATLSPGEPVEVPLPMGLVAWLPTQVKINQQGAITFIESEVGSVDNLLIALLTQGGIFEMTVYEGSPRKFTRGKIYRNCVMVTEPVDRDFESRQQPLLITGTLYYHYVGDDIDGNTESLNG